MDTGTTPLPGGSDRSWYIVGRWLEYEGESRANVLRLIAIAAFYVVELINYHGLNLGLIELPQVGGPQVSLDRDVPGGGVDAGRPDRAVLPEPSLLSPGMKFVSTGLDVHLPDVCPGGGQRSAESAAGRLLPADCVSRPCVSICP